MINLIAGLFVGVFLTYFLVIQHYEKRVNKAFWLWVDEQKIKGTICQEELKILAKEFNERTKGIVTFHKQDE